MKIFDEIKKTKVAGLPTQTTFSKTLNPNNTSSTNQRAITLLAIQNSPKTTVELRHELGIMMPAARVHELRALGYSIETIKVTSITPDGIKHKAVAMYVYKGSDHE
jgi:hypothetical protein